MKKAFRAQRITPAKMAIINKINEILEEYAKLGYRLTLRQLYYQLVARDQIPNTVQEYAKLSRTVVYGRMNGLIDWDHIEDRIRKPYKTYSVNSIEEAIKDTALTYKLDRQKGQGNHIEIWTEKDAVSNILKKSSTFYHVNLMVNRGYSSCSAMYEAFNRIDGSDQLGIILYVGDHDPSGLDMIRDIRERLREFGPIDFKVDHVALTREQIEKFRPPPNPAKTTDPRASWYIDNFGHDSWELDALKPEILDQIVSDSVLHYLDAVKFNKILEKEKKDRKKLKNAFRA